MNKDFFSKTKNQTNPMEKKNLLTMKSLIPFRAKLNCNNEVNLMYLARDRPKMLTRITIIQMIERKFGKKGMRQLCQAFKNSKGLKALSLNITRCASEQLRIFANWLRTSRNLKALELELTWGMEGINKGLSEVLSNLKQSKNLNSLAFEISRGRKKLFGKNPKPSIQLRYLKSLKGLKIIQNKDDHLNSPNNVFVLRSLKGLYWLNTLEFSYSFCSRQSDEDIDNVIELLRKSKRMTSLSLNFSKSLPLDEDIASQLFSSICKLDKLEAFHMNLDSNEVIEPEYIERFSAILGKKSSLKTLTFVGPKDPISKVPIHLNTKNINSLKSLSLYLSNSLQNNNNKMLENVSSGLENNPSFGYLNLFIACKDLSNESFKALGQGLAVLKNLTTLNIAFPNHTKLDNIEKMGYLTTGIKHLKALSNLFLDIGDCSVSEKEVDLIAESVYELENLKNLYLDIGSSEPQTQGLLSYFWKKKSKKTGLGSFGSVFQRQKSLSSLTLHLKNLEPSPEELDEFGSGVEGLKSLTSFEFYFEQLKTKEKFYSGLKTLYQSLETLEKLSSLVLRFSTVESEDLENLFVHLQGLKKLRSLEIYIEWVESMSYQAAEYFIKAMKELQDLRQLKLKIRWNQNIEMEMIYKFVDGFKEVEYLEKFDVELPGPVHCEKLQKLLFERSKSIKVLCPFIRYRCGSFLTPKS